MNIKKRGARLVGVLSAMLLAFGAQAAFAASNGTAVVSGSGTLSPGLTNQPQHQDYSFGGTAVITTDTAVGTATCNFSGGSTAADETIASGAGSISGTCTGVTEVLGTILATCDIGFNRVGAAVVATGACSGNPSGGVVGTVQFVPTNTTGTAYRAVAELVFANPL